MKDEELMGRIKDIQKRVENLEGRSYTGDTTGIMVLAMFIGFILHGCHF